MIIYGNTVLLRAIESEDNELLLSMINDPETEQMVGGSSWPVSKEDQKRWFEQQIGNKGSVLRCMIVRKDDEQAVGTVILSNIDQKNGTAEIHIKIVNNEFRGHGYGKDAIATMVQYAFDEMRLNCIYSVVLVHNEASARLFERAGFSKEGILRERIYKCGHYLDQFSYLITRRG